MQRSNQKMSLLNGYFKSIQEEANRVRTQLTALDYFDNPTKKLMDSIFDQRQEWEKANALVLSSPEQRRNIVEFERMRKDRLFYHVPKEIVELQQTLENAISPAIRKLQDQFGKLPEDTREALLLLGENGWFLDPDFSHSDLLDLKEAIGDGASQEATAALIEYFQSRLIQIENSITEKFPLRSKLINSAFGAHRRGEYILSIPVLLAQTDGICKETIGKCFFLKENKKPSTAIYVEQFAADAYMTALLSPLAEPLPISASEADRRSGAVTLNRHTVLHGESLDYGTMENSLKAISLINYVAQILQVQNP